MPISAILLDIGNVLVTFDHSVAIQKILPLANTTSEAFREALMTRIPELETGRMTTETFLKDVAEQIGYRGSIAQLEDAYCDIFQLNQPLWNLLARVPNSVRLCYFSNTSQLHEEFLMSKYPEFRSIADGIFSWRVAVMKPQSAFYQAGLDLLNRPAQEILYLDDLAANIEMGRQCGLVTHQYDHLNHAACEAEFARLGLLS